MLVASALPASWVITPSLLVWKGERKPLQIKVLLVGRREAKLQPAAYEASVPSLSPANLASWCQCAWKLCFPWLLVCGFWHGRELGPSKGIVYLEWSLTTKLQDFQFRCSWKPFLQLFFSGCMSRGKWTTSLKSTVARRVLSKCRDYGNMALYLVVVVKPKECSEKCSEPWCCLCKGWFEQETTVFVLLQ